MRVLSFERDGRPSFGIATDSGIIDAGARLAAEFPDLRAILDRHRQDQGDTGRAVAE